MSVGTHVCGFDSSVGGIYSQLCLAKRCPRRIGEKRKIAHVKNLDPGFERPATVSHVLGYTVFWGGFPTFLADCVFPSSVCFTRKVRQSRRSAQLIRCTSDSIKTRTVPQLCNHECMIQSQLVTPLNDPLSTVKFTPCNALPT